MLSKCGRMDGWVDGVGGARAMHVACALLVVTVVLAAAVAA